MFQFTHQLCWYYIVRTAQDLTGLKLCILRSLYLLIPSQHPTFDTNKTKSFCGVLTYSVTVFLFMCLYGIRALKTLNYTSGIIVTVYGFSFIIHRWMFNCGMHSPVSPHRSTNLIRAILIGWWTWPSAAGDLPAIYVTRGHRHPIPTACTVAAECRSIFLYLQDWGFVINRKKIPLSNAREVIVLGLALNSVSLTACLPEERVSSSRAGLALFRLGRMVRFSLCLLGLMALVIVVVWPGQLHMSGF